MTRRYVIRTGAGLAATAIIAVGGVAAADGGESHTQAGGTGSLSGGGVPRGRPPRGAKLPLGTVPRRRARPISPSATSSAS